MSQIVQSGTMPMTLQEIAWAVSGRLVMGGEPNRSFKEPHSVRVVSDSREAGLNTIFVAIRGEHVDGHDFLPGMGNRGVRAALVDHLVPGADLPQILVDDTIAALGLLARHNIQLRRDTGSPFTVIGITGSVGKTTTKDLLASLLSNQGRVVAPVGSFNNEIGLPLTALQVGEETRYLVAEMGANHLGEIAHLTWLVPPDLALVLKVGVAHLGEFGSVEGIAQAKSEIVKGLVPGGLAFLNADDPRVEAMSSLSPGRVVWFGMKSGRPNLEARASGVVLDGLDRPSFNLECIGQKPVRVQLKIAGIHNVMNAVAAAAVADYLGMTPEEIGLGLSRDTTISPHRMALGRVQTPRAQFDLIDDSFNANPDSMRAGLDALASWKGPQNTSSPFRIAVLGVMLELGSGAEGIHKKIGAYCRQLGLDALVAVGNGDENAHALVEAMVEGAREEDTGSDQALKTQDGNSHFQVMYAEGIEQAEGMVEDLASRHPGSLVLLKGSHLSGLSALADKWQE